LPKLLLFDILVVLRLDLGQISLSLVENAFATRQLAVLAIRIAFYDILVQACAKRFDFSNFPPSFFALYFSFRCSHWPFTGLAWG